MREDTTRVVHVHDKIPGAVYVGRATRITKKSPLANPYVIGTHGDRGRVIELYGVWLEEKIATGDRAVIEALIAARGKPLACWCRRDGEQESVRNACHAGVLVAILDMASDDFLRRFLR